MERSSPLASLYKVGEMQCTDQYPKTAGLQVGCSTSVLFNQLNKTHNKERNKEISKQSDHTMTVKELRNSAHQTPSKRYDSPSEDSLSTTPEDTHSSQKQEYVAHPAPRVLEASFSLEE